MTPLERITPENMPIAHVMLRPPGLPRCGFLALNRVCAASAAACGQHFLLRLARSGISGMRVRVLRNEKEQRQRIALPLFRPLDFQQTCACACIRQPAKAPSTAPQHAFTGRAKPVPFESWRPARSRNNTAEHVTAQARQEAGRRAHSLSAATQKADHTARWVQTSLDETHLDLPQRVPRPGKHVACSGRKKLRCAKACIPIQQHLIIQDIINIQIHLQACQR